MKKMLFILCSLLAFTVAANAQIPNNDAVNTEDISMRHPWLLDASLSDRISTYSAAFARLVKSSQAVFT